jgi:molybdopterin/thiamine biosynthesis adenylyltransferase
MLWPFAKNQNLNYRTLFADVTDKALNCQSLGVLAPLVGVIGAMQALMLVQQILKPDSQAKFWQFDGVDWRLRNYQLAALDNFQSEPILKVSQAAE